MKRENIYLASDSGKVVGFASWRRISNRLAEMSGVIVLEECKGKGIGSLLVEKVLKDARGLGCSTIGVKTEECNKPAIAFYRKCGFAPLKNVEETIGSKKITCLYLEHSL
jgi:ribosomal protein S18 acetylase RimI-like enzyme